MKYCSACGNKLKSGQTTCPFCGKKIKRKSEHVAPMSESKTEPEVKSKEKNVPLCVASIVFSMLAIAAFVLLRDLTYIAVAVAVGCVIVSIIFAASGKFPFGVVMGIIELIALGVFVYMLLSLIHFPSAPSPFPTDISDVYVVHILL